MWIGAAVCKTTFFSTSNDTWRTWLFSQKLFKMSLKKYPKHVQCLSNRLLSCHQSSISIRKKSGWSCRVEGFLRSIKPQQLQTEACLPLGWYALPVEWWSINSTSFQVRLHGRRRHGHHLITLHNKTQHQGLLLNWDKGNERAHLEWCLLLLWSWPFA